MKPFTEREVMTDKGLMRIWYCKKCRLLRTNKHTHKHSEPLPLDVIAFIKKLEEAENEKEKGN